ncbi:MAG TPA: hydroxymyristoyl-ACP dehydratase [Dokdonella sp.]|nr:hydroxymyristoyl-ACP dehydratase [Dokdonella sp.]
MTIVVRIGADHPSLPGHFPGNPIVPGVVLLDRVASAIERDGARLRRIHSVKFLAPLRPGEDATLALQRDGQRVRFRIERDGVAILGGEGELA